MPGLSDRPVTAAGNVRSLAPVRPPKVLAACVISRTPAPDVSNTLFWRASEFVNLKVPLLTLVTPEKVLALCSVTVPIPALVNDVGDDPPE